jgi:hypothetical protein
MTKVLKTGREHWRRLNAYYSKLCIRGRPAAYVSPLTISYSDFFVLFTLSS